MQDPDRRRVLAAKGRFRPVSGRDVATRAIDFPKENAL
jgi:hypothetical protein